MLRKIVMAMIIIGGCGCHFAVYNPWCQPRCEPLMPPGGQTYVVPSPQPARYQPEIKSASFKTVIHEN